VVLPVLRRALSDPHHLVRKAAVTGLRGLYVKGALEPLALALESAADVGRAAVDELIDAALAGNDDAGALARTAINAPDASVRSFALGRLPRLFESGSLEPWLLALQSNYADVRLSVVDRLVDSSDERVAGALSRAMESDHEDLRLKAATALARRGDRQTVDVLAGLLRSEESSVVKQATEALVALPFARPKDPETTLAVTAAAEAVAARLEDDPDQTANKPALMSALARIGSAAGAHALLALLGDENCSRRASSALMEIARCRDKSAQVLPDGVERKRYDELLALRYVRAFIDTGDDGLKSVAIAVLRDIDDVAAESVLERLVDDRGEAVRVAACEALAFRSQHVESATVEPLSTVLRAARRELVLPAALGLAAQGRPEAFQALMLVFKAGEPRERERALLALGGLGDQRALEELEPLVDPSTELEEGDRFLVPVAAEALGRMIPHLDGEEQQRLRETVERLAREGDDASRTRALAGLAYAADDRSRVFLERVAGDAHDPYRGAAIVHLGKLADSRSETVLAEALLADDRRVRRSALDAVRRLFPGDETRASLLALRSRHADIAGPAATFLARRGDAATLVAQFAEVEDGGVRRRLRRGLVRRGACPLEPLIDLLCGDQPGARGDAAWMAGTSGDTRFGGAVAEAAVRAASDWQAEAEPPTVDARLRECEEAWRAILWAALRVEADARESARIAVVNPDVPVSVRRAALTFLTVRGGAGDLDVIRPCLLDPAATVRAAAAEALAVLAPEMAAATLADLPVADVAAVAPVVEAALSTDGEELLTADGSRQLALPVVLGRKRLDELVVLVAGTGKSAARLTATASLGRIGGAQAQVALESILANSEEEDEVRATAFKALRRLQRSADKANRYREDA